VSITEATRDRLRMVDSAAMLDDMHRDMREAADYAYSAMHRAMDEDTAGRWYARYREIQNAAHLISRQRRAVRDRKAFALNMIAAGHVDGIVVDAL
jgi:hypothetical protein